MPPQSLQVVNFFGTPPAPSPAGPCSAVQLLALQLWTQLSGHPGEQVLASDFQNPETIQEYNDVKRKLLDWEAAALCLTEHKLRAPISASDVTCDCDL